MLYRKYSGACDVRGNDAVMCPRQAIRHILPDLWSRHGMSLCAVHLEQLRDEVVQHCAALMQDEEET